MSGYQPYGADVVGRTPCAVSTLVGACVHTLYRWYCITTQARVIIQRYVITSPLSTDLFKLPSTPSTRME